MSDRPLTEPRPEASREEPGPLTRIPRAAHARLLLHDLEADPPFGEVLREVLPDEAARLAYLNHLVWQCGRDRTHRPTPSMLMKINSGGQTGAGRAARR